MVFTALAIGRPLLLSDVGAFPELAATGAARLFARRRPRGAARRAAGAAGRPARLGADGRTARGAAAGPYGWGAVAGQTLTLYESLR